MMHGRPGALIPADGASGRFQGSSNKEGRMWGILIGLYIAVIIYPFIEEWQQKRADQSALANMRRHSAMGHRWDPTKGRWIDK